MNDELALDLMEMYFVSPEAWGRIRKKWWNHGFASDVISYSQVLEGITDWIVDRKPEMFRVGDVERALWKQSGDKNLRRKIKWVLRWYAHIGAIEIDFDPSTMELICTPVPEQWLD